VALGSWVQCSQTDLNLELTRDCCTLHVHCVPNVPPVGCVTCHRKMSCEISHVVAVAGNWANRHQTNWGKDCRYVTLPAPGLVVLGRWASCPENELDPELIVDYCSWNDALPNVCQAGCG
jgi:hypothetical protein